MSYNEALKDPRWQKKRLEILERDDWTCKICDSKDKTLHVHHKYYTEETRKEPWDIFSSALVTLCEDCHYACEKYQEEHLVQFLYDTGANTPRDIEILYSMLCDNEMGYDGLIKLLTAHIK